MPDPASSLHFTTYDVTESGSASAIFASMKPQDRCGIYVLRFEPIEGKPDEAYVGQAVDVLERFATHRRRWGDILTLEFARCGRDQLDDFERRTIDFVGKSASLRNILLTDRPGGWGDLEVTASDGRSALLPWERERRTTVAEEPADSPLARYWRLRAMPQYEDLRGLLATYVHETVPEPVFLAGGAFSVTALPKTAERRSDFRLCTVNCGSIETLFARLITVAGQTRVQVHVNLHPDTDLTRVAAIPAASTEEATYRSMPSTMVVAQTLELARYLLTLPELLEGAYLLNTALLRQGGRRYGKFHNHAFADDILTAIHDRLTRFGDV